MTYLEGACGTHYCNDVETYGGINTEMLHVGIGGYDGPAYFLPVDGVLGLDVLRIAPGLYVYDEYFVVCSGNDVQIQMVFPPVPVTNRISVAFQIGCCRIFSCFAQRIVCSQCTIFFLSVQKYVFSALFLQK